MDQPVIRYELGPAINGERMVVRTISYGRPDITAQQPVLSREPRRLTLTETSTGYRDGMREAGRGAQVR